jgi:outer membrane protein assembly factor BamB
MKKILKWLILLSFVSLASCTSTSPPLGNYDFPLSQHVSIPIGENIEEIAVLDSWIAVGTTNQIIAIDIYTYKQLWSRKFSVINYSEPGFRVIGDDLVAASLDEVIVINKFAETREINLDLNGNTITYLAGASPNYVYIIQGPKWTLDVFDTSKNELIWKTDVGRGSEVVYYDPVRDTLYAPTNGLIIAFDNSTGRLLWQKDGDVWKSTFEDELLFTFEDVNNNDGFRFLATNIESQDEVWEKSVVFEASNDINYLKILGDQLIAGSGRGLIAYDKLNGSEVWHILEREERFNTPPVELGGILFVKAASNTVYAVSPEDGVIIGSLKLEEPDSFEKNFQIYAGVYKLEDGIVFNTRNEILVYKDN